MGTNEQDEELLMVLEKYKEDIKFLHHQIRGQELTPDEILAKEDTETNKAKAALLAWRDQHTKEAVEAELRALLDNETKGATCVCQLADVAVCDHNWSLCNVVRDRLAELAAPQQSTSPDGSASHGKDGDE